MNLFVVCGVLAVISVIVMLLDKFILKISASTQKPPIYITITYSYGPLVIMVFVVLLLIRYFNFSLILTLATLVSLVVFVINLFFIPKRKGAVKAYINSVAEPDSVIVKRLEQGPAVIEFIRSLFPVLLIVFVLRSFIVEPFQIPSGSMKPTLGIGDFILVNKFAYGVRLPVINKVIIPVSKPKRGDVMVFHYPPNPEVDYIKRVIGVPGDRIQYTADKRLLINGQPIGETFIKKDQEIEEIQQYNKLLQQVSTYRVPVEYDLYKEQLADVEHTIYKLPDVNNRSPKPNSEWTVPEGYYFMMGDNRDNSKDSRFWIEDFLVKTESTQELNTILNNDRMYMVPEENIVGKAFFVWMHWPSPKLKSLPSFSDSRVIH